MPYDLKHKFKGMDERGNLIWENLYAPDLSLKRYIESPEIFKTTLSNILNNNAENINSDIERAMEYVGIDITQYFDNDHI